MAKKVVYISTVETGNYKGVRNKIQMQCNALKRLGYNVDDLTSGARTAIGQIEKLLPHAYGLNQRIIKRKLKTYSENQIDYCYYRFSPACRGMIDILATLKKKNRNIKIVMEIPTFPYLQEMKNIRSIPFYLKDLLYKNKIHNYVDLIVTPSKVNEETIFGVEAMEIFNGTDVTTIKRRCVLNKEDNCIRVLGVALISKWHGYERIIRGISDYMTKKAPEAPSVLFYVVGDGPALDELVALTKELNIENSVLFEGRKEGKELDYFYNIADVGVGTLGLYKINNHERDNSLKTKEYCAKGLPFITTRLDYMFDNDELPFVLHVTNDDTPIDIKGVIDFVSNLYSKNTNNNIVELMSTYADEHLSWDIVMKRVLTKLDEM